MRDDAIRRRRSRASTRWRRGDEIAERVGLVGELAVLVPAPALLGSAAHMGDRVDEAAIDQRQAIGGELASITWP